MVVELVELGIVALQGRICLHLQVATGLDHIRDKVDFQMGRRELVEELPARDLEQPEAQEQTTAATVATAMEEAAVAVGVINFLVVAVELAEEFHTDTPAKAA